MQELTDKLIEFRNKRRWEKYHTPNNLAQAISIESAELLECFLWDREIDQEAIKDEIADIAIYLLYMCHAMNIDLKEVIERKIEKNNLKYPANKKHEW